MDDAAMWPRAFKQTAADKAYSDPYLRESATYKLATFFWTKGLAALSEEDAAAVWYQDWLDYQAKHRIYASVLSPAQYSTLGHHFDLLKLTRLLEVFAYFSPSHGYSLQVSFLGLFSILMGSNEAMKREAVTALEAGGLLAFGVSEKEHGSDLLSNEFRVTNSGAGAPHAATYVADGRKYYIGNSNCARIISILARKYRHESDSAAADQRRAPFVLMALRPASSPGYRNLKKVRTSGVRSAFVGEFEVKHHTLPASDLIAEGRTAWDAIFGTVTLGKFFLGFGSIGICEHAMEEAIGHVRNRVLYRKPVLELPHIRLAMAQAYARLLAMKLYAYRALDYVQAAGASDRRYLLFCAVQKAKVSTEGVKVLSLLSECVGAKGFETDTYFESALRNIQLIPGLEGSTHINLAATAQFVERYFQALPQDAAEGRAQVMNLPEVKSLTRGDTQPIENPYLMQARGGRINNIVFTHFLNAYAPLKKESSNVRRFIRQAAAFGRFVRQGNESEIKNPTTTSRGTEAPDSTPSESGTISSQDLRLTLSMGQCTAIIAYAQLIAENAILFQIPSPVISAMFHLLVLDFSAAGSVLAALPGIDRVTRSLARRLIAIPCTSQAEWEQVVNCFHTVSDE